MALVRVQGRCSYFGGPADTGVTPDEGLAFFYEYDDAPHLFLDQQPPETTGLARRLNPDVFYVAIRWDYDVTPKEMLADSRYKALVRAGGKEFLAYPSDWGPHHSTDRVADISPGLMAALGISTDDEVEVVYPAASTTKDMPMRIVISSGHGKLVRGANGEPEGFDEVDEARKVVDRVAELWRSADIDVDVFHDNTSTTQSQNLNTIVAHHNSQERDVDVSVHFNAFDGHAHGTEVLYVTQSALAAKVSAAIAKAGDFLNRGAKYRSDLAFLNNTEEPAILLEVCFCDSPDDSEAYFENMDEICQAIAACVPEYAVPPTEPVAPPAETQTVYVKVHTPPGVRVEVTVEETE